MNDTQVTVTLPRESARLLNVLIANDEFRTRAEMLRILRDEEPGDDAMADACMATQSRAYVALYEARMALIDACEAADTLTWEERASRSLARLLYETRERVESSADIVRMVKGLRMAMRATNAVDALED